MTPTRRLRRAMRPPRPVLVVQTTRPLSAEASHLIRAAVRRQVGPDRPVLVTGPDLEVTAR